MSSKKSNNNTKKYNANILLCSKLEQENFDKVANVMKLQSQYPNMSLSSAIKHSHTTFPTYYKYKDLVEKLRISELI